MFSKGIPTTSATCLQCNLYYNSTLKMTYHNSTSWHTNICAVVTHFHTTNIIFDATICQSAFFTQHTHCKKGDSTYKTQPENVSEYISFRMGEFCRTNLGVCAPFKTIHHMTSNCPYTYLILIFWDRDVSKFLLKRKLRNCW